VLRSHTNHQDLISTLHKLCANTVGKVETQLAKQKVLDEAEARKMEEDKKRIDKMAQLEAEQVQNEKADVLGRMKEEEDNIKAMEYELEVKRKALHNAQRGAKIIVNDEATISTVREQVCDLLHVLFYSILTIATDYIRGLQRRRPNGKWRRKVTKNWRKPFTPW
jgi:hypothetical protein